MQETSKIKKKNPNKHTSNTKAPKSHMIEKNNNNNKTTTEFIFCWSSDHGARPGVNPW